MMDSAVVTVSSGPLLPPCSNTDLCQRFSIPPGTVAIEFRVGGGPQSPDWSKAPTQIGGQPAYLTQPRVQLLFGTVADTARVQHEEVGIGFVGGRLIAFSFQESSHAFGVVEVHLTTERLQPVFTRHAYLSLSLQPHFRFRLLP